ncbi:hypothetical protein PV11_02658 [Exophiala sideris]|uniref:Cytochrome b561 domain-containing protein n=1 Tax=Exophiala sideris TaxID=1016849 RepID=A0A0D1ZJZ1_9EURO|nr:hypothetical protein PV11_02658 [Exophiala sideris]
MARSTTLALVSTALLFATTNAQFGGFGGGFGGGNGNPFDGGNGNGNGGSSSGNSGSSSSDNSQYGANMFGSTAEFNRAKQILIAHAVLASLVWVIFIPSLAILLRLDIQNPVVLRIHAVGQVLSYIIFVVAAGMGIWLAQKSSAYGIWDNPHPRLGLAILTIAFFQPIFGFVHHRIYKKRALEKAAGKATKAPGRTAIGRIHLWVGRMLIFLAIINGGLGIRLASSSPFQTDSQTRKAGIAYGSVAAVMVVLYLFCVVAFEIRRARHLRQQQRNRQAMATKDTLPTYDESEESVGRSTRSS